MSYHYYLSEEDANGTTERIYNKIMKPTKMNARILDVFRVLRKYEVPLQIRICNALETYRQPRTSEFGLQSRRVHDAR